MYELYKNILIENKKSGCVKVQDMVKNPLLSKSIDTKLVELGYQINGLDKRSRELLFFSLVDILFIVKGDSFYLATLSKSKLQEIAQMGRLIKDNWDNSVRVVNGSTVPVVNKYIEQGQLHLIKLNRFEKYGYFLASVSGMKPYPKFSELSEVYTLEIVTSWFNEVTSKLQKSVCKLSLNHGTEICQSLLQRSKTIPTDGEIITTDVDDNSRIFNIWDIKSCEPYSVNPMVTKMLNGVVTYKGEKLTLNRDILEEYYGDSLYKVLESENVRKRRCLEELISPKGVIFSPSYYREKYKLDIPNDKSNIVLISELRKEIKQSEPIRNNVVHARVIGSIEPIVHKHKSFYRTINLNNVKEYEVEVVSDVSQILPKTYKYAAVSSQLGYNFVTITTTSERLALKRGEEEFKRQFGDQIKVCTLMESKNSNIIKGLPIFLLPISEQQNLYQYLQYSYVHGFREYYDVICSMCNRNRIPRPTEEQVKYLFTNKLAKSYGKEEKLNQGVISYAVVEFLALIQSKENADKLLIQEYIKLATPRAYSEWLSLRRGTGSYTIEDTPSGKYIQTRNARFKLDKDGRVIAKVDLFFNGKFLCSKIFKDEES